MCILPTSENSALSPKSTQEWGENQGREMCRDILFFCQTCVFIVPAKVKSYMLQLLCAPEEMNCKPECS